MRKIVELFRDIRFEEFLRVVISDNALSLVHINNNKVIKKIDVELIDKLKIFDYIKERKALPLEIIISSNTISCRSITLEGLREKDMISLAHNVIDGKNGSVNLICYEKKFSYRKGSALFCDMKLTPITITILQEAIKIGNLISAIAAWPFWLVSSFFRLHSADVGKFKGSIFVTKQHNSWEVIALHNEKHVYYRKGLLDGFDEKSEVDNAIKFIKQLFNLDLDDIIIYKIDDETIDTFTMGSSINMKIVSKDEKLEINDKTRRTSLILKSACLLLFAGIFSNTVVDIVKIFNYHSRANKAEKTIKSIEPEIVNEIAAWNGLEEFMPLKHVDVKSKLAEKLKNGDKKLQNATIKIDEKTKQETINTIYEED